MEKAKLGKLKGLSLRSTQIDGIEFVRKARENKKRFVALRAPTGVGKTCLGFESTQPPFFYVCSSISLQEQAERDYPEAVVLKGRANYRCPEFGSADLCIKGKPCNDCEYQLAKRRAMASPMTILNFHYYMYGANFTEDWQINRNVIIDEADDLESVLVGFISFEFTKKQLEWLGMMPDMPDKKQAMSVVPKWIGLRYQEALMVQKSMMAEVKELKGKANYLMLGKYDQIKLRKWIALANLVWKLRFLQRQKLAEEWIFRYDEVPDKKVAIKPIWLTRELMDEFFLSHGKDFLFMSATLPAKEVFCGLYGFKAEEVAYADLPNVWESDKRQVIYRPRYNLSYKNKNKETYGKVKAAVKEIMLKEKGRGVIHAVSYALQGIVEEIEDERIVVHHGKNRAAQFNYFKDTEGAVWVSPSSARGLDLPYDLCEWVVWLKAPFLHVQDPQTNARLYGSGKFGKTWYASDACQSILQGCGRGFRNEDDYCTVYLLDEQIGRLLQTQQTLFPMWFRDLVWEE